MLPPFSVSIADCDIYKKKQKNANLWDEKTIAFIILSLDEARHIFV
jgi:hypothetical protein